jgi:response regulator RpfG family c-di-GMP phosphodiesterase
MSASKRSPWEDILDAMPDIIVGTDRLGVIQFFKGKVARRFGLEEKLMPYRNLWDVFRTGQYTVSGVLPRHYTLRPNGTKSEPINAMFELTSHSRSADGNEIWVFKDVTDTDTISRFMDNYHDSLEKELMRLVDEKNKSLETMTHSLVNALENANLYNDTETGNHNRRIGEYSGLLSQKLGCPIDFVKKIRLYAPLHDIGKVGIPDTILKKKGVYQEDELVKIREHVLIGARMLSHPEIEPMAKNIALYHHEKWDGTGYMQGLKGKAIPLEARVVCLADTYDGMRSEREYKKAATHDETLAFMKSGSGTSFDPDVLEAFLQIEVSFEKIIARYR